MSLSTEGIDHIFARLAGTYMAGWDRFVGNTPISDVKTIWGYELSEFGLNNVSKRRILWALDNLPERPPNAIEFKRLCRQAPGPFEVVLPPPPVDAEKVAKELMKLGEARLRSAVIPVGRLDWAHRIKERCERDPKSVTRAVRKMAFDALEGV